ncbi:MAG TPA: hypothetical protein VGG67_03265 [Steroidobacteraceae bacterium]|jgi:hypothetical protein
MASRRSESLLESPAAAATLQRELRRRLHLCLFDESGVTPAGTAIYSLADPREARIIRYIGQTAQPPRRFMQHLRTARLWLPHERPWWIAAPRLRPLYHWIRDLYSEEGRLPVMLVHAWVEARHAPLAERDHIRMCLERQLPLLNIVICQMAGGKEATTR